VDYVSIGPHPCTQLPGTGLYLCCRAGGRVKQLVGNEPHSLVSWEGRCAGELVVFGGLLVRPRCVGVCPCLDAAICAAMEQSPIETHSIGRSTAAASVSCKGSASTCVQNAGRLTSPAHEVS
jgi:hypothetical protein